MKKKLKKRRLVVLIIIVVILVIAVITLIQSISRLLNGKNTPNMLNSNSNSIGNSLDYRSEYENVIKETKEDFLKMNQIVPDNYNIFAKMYSGEVPTKRLYEKLYSLVYDIIPKTYNDLKGKNQNEIEEYYYKNIDNIKNDLGIDNVEDYIRFANKALEIANNTYVSALMDVNNFSQKGNYTNIDINITYSELSVLFVVSVINNESESDGEPTFIIRVK